MQKLADKEKNLTIKIKNDNLLSFLYIEYMESQSRSKLKYIHKIRTKYKSKKIQTI
jgi:hypothetical protein